MFSAQVSETSSAGKKKGVLPATVLTISSHMACVPNSLATCLFLTALHHGQVAVQSDGVF